MGHCAAQKEADERQVGPVMCFRVVRSCDSHHCSFAAVFVAPVGFRKSPLSPAVPPPHVPLRPILPRVALLVLVEIVDVVGRFFCKTVGLATWEKRWKSFAPAERPVVAVAAPGLVLVTVGALRLELHESNCGNGVHADSGAEFLHQLRW